MQHSSQLVSDDNRSLRLLVFDVSHFRADLPNSLTTLEDILPKTPNFLKNYSTYL